VGGVSMNGLQFSIITPTFNRAATLERMLRHLLSVEGIHRCEIIVIDDGSTDGTAATLIGLRRRMPELLRVITLTNGGPARARNAGLHAARYERLLFIDDDVFPRPDMLKQHWQKLEEGYDGSQGLLEWHTEIAKTPLIDYIDARGSQFAFDQVERPDDLGGEHIYTGNFAVRRDAVLHAGGFCEALFDRKLAFSAFEDTVLGYALKEHGARLALHRGAVADHLHHMTEPGFLRREYNVGSGVAQLQRQFPEIAKELGLEGMGRLLRLQIAALSVVNRVAVLRVLMSYPWSMRLRHREAFLRGYLRYERDYPKGKGLEAAWASQ
jgi:glycosyltransferase involved in cell wall biosynthesis